MSLSLSLSSDALSGRRMFLIGSTLSAISLFLPWYVGQSIIPVFFDLPGFAGATASGFATGGWIEFAITGVVPWIFLISRQAMPIGAKALALPFFLAVIILEIMRILYGRVITEELTYFQAGGIGQWLFIAAQILCLIAILRFPLRKHQGMKVGPPPLPEM
jgi:hypothetical protein